MRVAFGLKAHSGWAALVALAAQADAAFLVVERRRIELVENFEAEWAGQPYHAAEGKPAAEARTIVERGIAEAQRAATRALHEARTHMEARGHEVAGCAVLCARPMPVWSVEQILSVHLRMHQAEGALYPGALIHAARGLGIAVSEIPQRALAERARDTFGARSAAVERAIAALGKTVGAPWGADQKAAALAAAVALYADQK
ncbi:MAG TPA: hypothetical protein VFB32_02770 [Rudaea sp.]|nr:hypothetical protein [Rudaea sp.]